MLAWEDDFFAIAVCTGSWVCGDSALLVPRSPAARPPLLTAHSVVRRSSAGPLHPVLLPTTNLATESYGPATSRVLLKLVFKTTWSLRRFTMLCMDFKFPCNTTPVSEPPPPNMVSSFWKKRNENVFQLLSAIERRRRRMKVGLRTFIYCFEEWFTLFL